MSSAWQCVLTDRCTGIWHVGEERAQVRAGLVHAAIVTEGVALTSEDMLKVALLSQVFGSQPGVAYSSTMSATKLYKVVSTAVPDHNFAVCTCTQCSDTKISDPTLC